VCTHVYMFGRLSIYMCTIKILCACSHINIYLLCSYCIKVMSIYNATSKNTFQQIHQIVPLLVNLLARCLLKKIIGELSADCRSHETDQLTATSCRWLVQCDVQTRRLLLLQYLIGALVGHFHSIIQNTCLIAPFVKETKTCVRRKRWQRTEEEKIISVERVKE